MLTQHRAPAAAARAPRETALLALLLGWLVLVAGGAVAAAARVGGRFLGPILHPTPQAKSLAFIALLFATVLLPVVLVRQARPHLTIPCLALVASGIAALLAIGAGALPDLLWLFLLALTGHELGRWALVALRALPLDRAERTALALGLGGGLMALWVLAIGLVGLLTLPAILLPILAFVAAALFRLRTTTRNSLRSALDALPQPTWFETLLLAGICDFLLIGYTMALAPEVMSDAYRVHLPIARIFAEQHRIGELPQQPFAYWPLHGQALFASGMVLRGPILAKLIHTATGLLAVLAAGVVGRRYAHSTTAGIVAAALFATLPVTVWEMGVGYIDLFVAAYAALVALCLLQLRESFDWRWGLILGACLGLGLDAKLLFGFVIIAAIVAVPIVAPAGTSPAGRVRPLLWVAAGGAVAAGPWLARTLWLTGTLPGLSVLTGALGWSGTDLPDLVGNLEQFGIGRGPLALLRLPWELTVHSRVFGENTNGFIGFALLVLLPLLLLLPRRAETAALALLVAIPFACWAFTAQYLRYLLPTLVLLTPLLGGGFVTFERRVRATFRRGATIGRALRLGLVAVIFTSTIFYFNTIAAYPGRLPVRLVLGQEDGDTYLAHTLRGYRATRFLDSVTAPGEPVAALPEGLQLYTHTTLIDHYRVAPDLLHAETIPQLLEVLARRQVRYILVNQGAIAPTWATIWIVHPDFLRQYTDVVYAAEGVIVYRLHPDRAQRLAPPELLHNPGFEDGQAGPDGWEAFGTATYQGDGSEAYAGRGAVRATVAAGYRQPVPVQGGQPYLLSAFARAEQDGGLGGLRVTWRDEAGRVIGQAEDAFTASNLWRWYALPVAAPAGARTAEVTLTVIGDVPFRYDDASFTQQPAGAP